MHHPQQGQAARVQSPTVSMEVTSIELFEAHPQVDQQEGDADVQQSQSRIGRRCSGAHPVHLAVAGFDAKASAVELKDLQWLSAHAECHIGEPLRAYPNNPKLWYTWGHENKK
jgi:hypothetical protein